MRRQLEIGDIVKLKTNLLGNPEGTQGFVYEIYYLSDKRGISVIFENGEYDGFSEHEQNEFLERIGYSDNLSDYRFLNVMKLSRDFDNGIFDETFE